ncbi:TonB-dependent receptor domain-containing protein [Pedobacter sp. AW1-32]|uniref:TonB-dependent receptor domain-containing protein n=1 Tax=Pedobacter sp. AW1-32 TaxID=3383026 RepID=UPI003FF04514
MKTIYTLLCLSFALIPVTKVLAQDNKGNIQGIILDEHQKPADYVTVVLMKASDSSVVKTAFTNPDGKFVFNINVAGGYFYKASNMGYKVLKSEVKTLSSGSDKLDFGAAALVPNTQTLNEVTVSTTKPLIERKMDRVVMNVSNSSIATGSTALELLQKAPGVSVDQNDNIAMLGKQGVMIQIDGKLTYMSNADVANLLRNMQSSEIESIELITNPSSKYDASGNSGIINIKTKKNKGGGTNGSVTATAGQGQKFRSSAGLNLNHRTKYVNLFGNYNYYNNKRTQFMSIDRISSGNTGNTYFGQAGNSERKYSGSNFKAGLDVFIDKKNTIGALVTGYFNDGNDAANYLTNIGPSFSRADSVLSSTNRIENNYKNLSYNLNYKSVLDTAGQELTADLDYSNYNGKDISNYANLFSLPNGIATRPIILTRNTTPSKIDIKAFKVDYVLPLKHKMKLEAGLKSSWVETDNNLFAEQFSNNNWQNDPGRTNQFIYTENVNAAYVNFNKQFKKTGIQLGLRAEQTNSKGNSVTTATVIKREYVDFFPTVFINQELSKNSDLNISYSRRIDRPSYDALNPFLFYVDQYTYNQGNPFLNPQYTNNFELTYMFKKKYSLTLNYSKVNDVITEVILPNNEMQALYQTNENLATQTSYAAVLSIPVNFAKWWQSNNTINGFYLNFKAPDLGGIPLDNESTSVQIKSMHTFTFNKGLGAELMGSYESPITYGVLRIKTRWGIDVGLSKSLMNKKASIKLSINDIFNTQRNNIESAYPGLQYTLYQNNDIRSARLSFTYRFGNNEIKPARRRTTGVEAEQGRMKN